MRLLLSSTLTVLFLSTPLATSAQTLWANATYGMTKDEVRAAVVGLIVPDRPAELGTGATEGLRLERYCFADAIFDVHFYFKDERLHQVSFEYSKRDRFENLRPIFEAAVRSLRASHGAEARNDKILSGHHSLEARWLSQGVSIGVNLMGVAPNTNFLNVNFQMKPTLEVPSGAPRALSARTLNIALKHYELREVQRDQKGGWTNLYFETEPEAAMPAVFTVRHWPEVTTITEVDAAWQRSIPNPLLTEMQTFKADESEHANEVFHVAWIGDPPTNGFFQAFFIRFVIEPDVPGVMAYESTLPIDVHGDWSDRYAKIMNEQFEALRGIKLTVYDAMPPSPGTH